MPCPDCGHSVYVRDLGEGKCLECGKQVNIEYLVEQYRRYRDPKDELIDPSIAYCNQCEYEDPTVIPWDDQWLCLYCLTVHEGVGSCGWCGELVTGDLGESYLTGCVRCEGRLGSLDEE